MYDVTVSFTNDYLRGLPTEGLKLLSKEARATQLTLRTQKAQAGGHTDRPHLFKKVRRDIARIETELRRPL